MLHHSSIHGRNARDTHGRSRPCRETLLRETNPIWAPGWRSRQRGSGAGVPRTWSKLCETNPIWARAIWKTSTVPTRTCDELDAERARTKQTQFPSPARSGQGFPPRRQRFTASLRTGLPRIQSQEAATGGRESGVNWRANRAKQTQFAGGDETGLQRGVWRWEPKNAPRFWRRLSFAPVGLGRFRAWVPTVETVGYFQSSLRDCSARTDGIRPLASTRARKNGPARSFRRNR